MDADRYSRQVLAFGNEGQQRIQAARVGIVGLGGLGAHMAQGLAYLGVGSFVLVDDDHVDESNLNRLIGAYPHDATAAEPKVSVAERHIHLVNPAAEVVTIPRNLRSRYALTALMDCPVIFGCVDHDAPRLILTELAAAYESTLIDSATEIAVEAGTIREFGGRVVVARPGAFCLDCAHQIDMHVAKQELEGPLAREVRKAFGYGLGDQGKSPAVVSLNGVVANLAITEFLMMTTEVRQAYNHVSYYGLRGRVNLRDDQRRSDCFICGYLAGKRHAANIFRYAVQE